MSSLVNPLEELLDKVGDAFLKSLSLADRLETSVAQFKLTDEFLEPISFNENDEKKRFKQKNTFNLVFFCVLSPLWWLVAFFTNFDSAFSVVIYIFLGTIWTFQIYKFGFSRSRKTDISVNKAGIECNLKNHQWNDIKYTAILKTSRIQAWDYYLIIIHHDLSFEKVNLTPYEWGIQNKLSIAIEYFKKK